jgi:hypothetical protein
MLPLNPKPRALLELQNLLVISLFHWNGIEKVRDS